MLSNLIVACVISVGADQRIVSLVDNAADKYRIPRSLMHAIVHQESKYQPSAINRNAPVISYGLGQLTKTTAFERCGLSLDRIMDQKSNLDCSTKYMARQLKRYKGDEFKAISAYNLGSYNPKNMDYILSVWKKRESCHK